MRLWFRLLLVAGLTGAGLTLAQASEASRLNWRLHLASDREKIAIAHRLGEICDPISVRYLVDLSESSQTSVRRASIDALVDLLALPYERTDAAQSAGQRLREMGSEAVPALTRALDPKRPRRAMVAAYVLGEIGVSVDPSRLLKLMTAAVSPYPRVRNTVGFDVEMARQAAGSALIRLEATMVVGPELKKWLGSPSPSERNIAIDGFEELSYPPALPALIDLHSDEQPIWIARAHQHDPAALAKGFEMIRSSSADSQLAGITILGAEGSQTARDALASAHFPPHIQSNAGAALLRWNDSRGWDLFLSSSDPSQLWRISSLNRNFAGYELSRRAKSNPTAAQLLRYLIVPARFIPPPIKPSERVLVEIHRRMIKELNGDPRVTEQVWQPLVNQAREALRGRFTPQSVGVDAWNGVQFPITGGHLDAHCQRLPGVGGAILLSLSFPMLYSLDPARGIVERNPMLRVLFWQAHGRIFDQNVTRLFQVDRTGQLFRPQMERSRQFGSEILFVGHSNLPALSRTSSSRYWSVADLFCLEGKRWISGGRWQRSALDLTAAAILLDGHLALRVEDRGMTGLGHPFTCPYLLNVRRSRLLTRSPDPRLDPLSLLYHGIVDGEKGDLHLLADTMSSTAKATEALHAVNERENGDHDDGWTTRVNRAADRATVKLFKDKPPDTSKDETRRLLTFQFLRVGDHWKIVEFSSTEIPFSIR